LSNLVNGWDFVLNQPIDQNNAAIVEGSHGTNIAGIIGAVGTNHRGLSGVVQEVSLVPLRIARGPFTSFSNIVNGRTIRQNAIYAISWAINHQIDIINFSHTEFIDNYSPLLLYHISNFSGLFVTIANNHNVNMNNLPFLKYRNDNTITVGALTETAQRRSNSGWGSTAVDLFAPGQRLVTVCRSTTVGIPNVIPSSYAIVNNTSNAAPFVTGTAALILSRYSLTGSQLRQAIMQGVTVLPQLENCTLPYVNNPNGRGRLSVTGGRLNAYGALNAARNLSMGKFIFTPTGGNTDGWSNVSVRLNPNIEHPRRIIIPDWIEIGGADQWHVVTEIAAQGFMGGMCNKVVIPTTVGRV